MIRVPAMAVLLTGLAAVKTIRRTSVLWGLGGSITVDPSGRRLTEVFPFGVLYHRISDNRHSSIHVLGIPFQ
jgi:hypothetical protein